MRELVADQPAVRLVAATPATAVHEEEHRRVAGAVGNIDVHALVGMLAVGDIALRAAAGGQADLDPAVGAPLRQTLAQRPRLRLENA